MTEELAPKTIYSIQQWDIWKALSNNDIGQIGTVMDNNMKYYISCIDADPELIFTKTKCWDLMQMKSLTVNEVCGNHVKFLVKWRNQIYK